MTLDDMSNVVVEGVNINGGGSCSNEGGFWNWMEMDACMKPICCLLDVIKLHCKIFIGKDNVSTFICNTHPIINCSCDAKQITGQSRYIINIFESYNI